MSAGALDALTPLALAGCGNMGRALLEGWLAKGLEPADVQVVDPSADAQAYARSKGVRPVARAEALDPATRAVVLAVKPQMIEAVAPAYAGLAGEALFVSILAGTTTGALEGLLGEGAAIVRAMPNTPALIGEGASVLVANKAVSAAQKTGAQALFEAAGLVLWIEDESLMDAVTALSGSGPAYVFLMIEAMAEAGERLGLPADAALALARQTVKGAGALAAASPEPPSTLRERVTSPGGTTAAALEVLMGEDRLKRLIEAAMEAARRRGGELG